MARTKRKAWSISDIGYPAPMMWILRIHMETNTMCGVFLNIDCLKCLEVTRGDLHVSCKQPPRPGRIQGWGLWADSPLTSDPTFLLVGLASAFLKTFLRRTPPPSCYSIPSSASLKPQYTRPPCPPAGLCGWLLFNHHTRSPLHACTLRKWEGSPGLFRTHFQT